MPRNKRLQANSKIYHVVVKGLDRQLLFEEPKDFKKYLALLEFYKSECSFEIFAYCLMSNHIHLLIRISDTSLETIFRRLNTAYAGWFNMKYDRTGFVQDGRYYSEPVETKSYLLSALRYIHQNPVKAGLEKKCGSYYPWTSYQDYVHSTDSSLTDTTFILKLIGGVTEFRNWHEIYSEEAPSELVPTRKRLPDDVAKDIIRQECGCSFTAAFQEFTITERNQHLNSLHKKGLSIRQLNRLTGVSRGIIERVISP